MTATGIETAALFRAILAIPIGWASLVAKLACPASRARALAVVGIAARAVLALAVLQTVLAPLGEGTLWKKKWIRRLA